VDRLGSDFFGQLYAGLSADETQLRALGEPVRFGDGPYAGYLDGGMLTVPDVPAGAVVQAQVRLWRVQDGPSFEAALAAGRFTARTEVVSTVTSAPLVDGRPAPPPRPLNHFATLRLADVPHFLSEPADLVVRVGQDAVLSVRAGGAEPLLYQWHRDGVPLPGETAAELRIPAAQRNDSGSYRVSLSNPICVMTSSNALLTVYEPLQLVNGPVDTVAGVGETAEFSVLAIGEPPLRYQWHWSVADPSLGTRVVSAQSSGLVINRVIDDSAGDFWVEVSSPYETVVSSSAHLSVTNGLAVALDTPTWTYRSGGSYPWRVGTNFLRGTPTVATTGPFPSSGDSWIETRIDGEGVLSFWWMTQPVGKGMLLFLVDGQLISTPQPGGTWRQVTRQLSRRSHTVRWHLIFTANANEPQARAWMDEVKFQPASPYLQIGRRPEGTLLLSWAREATGFVLERTMAGAFGGPWHEVSEPVAVLGNAYVVSVAADTSNSWFRLRLP